ncbi:hypothetical protein [Niallia sp. NCCP-28]|uniref:hypothetical protein n=1 Tax=Niallia sp. NCCP-28 TaxID=2934712 RepID=UPI002088BB0F|nr:hypothetical protein [Niallia sp. NCCP-28]GKU84612.1 hypothetical protein NCCP28_40080 [Niallia sp. NCCP-28]
MKWLEKLLNWMLVIGLLLLAGRIITAVCMFFNVSFTSFFKDYSIISIIILLIGLLGTQVMKTNKQ